MAKSKLKIKCKAMGAQKGRLKGRSKLGRKDRFKPAKGRKR